MLAAPSISFAKSMHPECLLLSYDNKVGQGVGDFHSNADILASSAITEDMRLHSLTVCQDENLKLAGLNFHLAENAYTDLPGDRVDLGAIGKLEGTCKTLKLSQSVDRIRAIDRVRSRVKIVEDILILSGQYALSIGEVDGDFTQWVFDENEPLVGVYGRQWNDITQMGFITLDTACQAAVVEEQEIIEEPVVI